MKISVCDVYQWDNVPTSLMSVYDTNVLYNALLKRDARLPLTQEEASLLEQWDNEMSKPLPFDEISPDYGAWWRTYKPKGAQMLTRHAFWDKFKSRGNSYTVADAIQVIEDEYKCVLRSRGTGIKTVIAHIETFYKHGLVTEQWYQEQMGRYQGK